MVLGGPRYRLDVHAELDLNSRRFIGHVTLEENALTTSVSTSSLFHVFDHIVALLETIQLVIIL